MLSFLSSIIIFFRAAWIKDYIFQLNRIVKTIAILKTIIVQRLIEFIITSVLKMFVLKLEPGIIVFKRV